MEEKLRRLMKHEGINSTRLAEILGIQASGISHIMSGRNNPSYDFLLKLLQRFPQINPDWLLLDKGPMYRDEIKQKNQASTSTQTSTLPTGQMASGVASGTANSGVGAMSGTVVGTNSTGSVMGAAIFPRDAGARDNEDIIPARETREMSGGASGMNGATREMKVTNGANGEMRDTGEAKRDAGDFNGPGGRYSEVGSGTRASTGSGAGLDTISGAGMGSAAGFGAGADGSWGATGAGNFTRTGSIDRIVVFYKDKTFSEYRPA